jgi:hypothetical protein
MTFPAPRRQPVARRDPYSGFIEQDDERHPGVIRAVTYTPGRPGPEDSTRLVLAARRAFE